MAEPFIKLYKKMLDWEWYDNPNTCRVFIHCLLRANWKPCRWHGQTIEAGQFITSLQTLADETCLSVKQVRVALKHLIETGEVASKGQSKYRIITVNNWDEYQQSGKQEGKQGASKGQARGKQRATDKEYKEYKEVKNKYYEDPNIDLAFADYVLMRKQIKKPMSDRAIELAKIKLDKLSGGDVAKAVAILNQSIMNSWQGLFDLKEENKTKFGNFTQRSYDYKALEDEAFGGET